MKIRAVLDRAKQIANTQGRLANSPAELEPSGSFTLCAASCLAKAMIELSADPELTRNFNTRLLMEDKFTFLPHVFERHGFSAESAKWAVMENDKTIESERLPWFNSLESLKPLQSSVHA